MFDWIKRVIALTDCRGCRHRRWGGLRCAKVWNKPYRGPSLWSKYGCWHFAEDRPRKREARRGS